MAFTSSLLYTFKNNNVQRKCIGFRLRRPRWFKKPWFAILAQRIATHTTEIPKRAQNRWLRTAPLQSRISLVPKELNWAADTRGTWWYLIVMVRWGRPSEWALDLLAPEKVTDGKICEINQYRTHSHIRTHNRGSPSFPQKLKSEDLLHHCQTELAKLDTVVY